VYARCDGGVSRCCLLLLLANTLGLYFGCTKGCCNIIIYLFDDELCTSELNHWHAKDSIVFLETIDLSSSCEKHTCMPFWQAVVLL
jgi:hypothetical protein